MYCPNCGNGEQSPNAYCKRCGQWLSDHKAGRGRTATPQERMNVMLAFNVLSAVFGIFAAIALYATHLGDGDVKWSVHVAATFCLIIAVHQAISFLLALDLRRRLKRSHDDTGGILGTGAGDSAGSLGSGETTEFVGARSSVTENTTELLEPVRRAGEPGQSG
ncbi:MAG: hypothetical protein H7Z38_05500 [Rubrivivax sp.]|nr:hypothetical protein [Pyrinomonadaceae bacterium]